VLDVGGELVCLPLEEYAVDPVGKPVRDAADKLRGSGDDLALVAKTSTHAWIVPPARPGEAVDPVVAGVHEAARACYRALGCRDYGLFDFRLDPDGRAWFLEAGLYWAFARQSVISVMATADGLDLPALLAEALEHARTRGTPVPSPTGDPR
jgi:D-alanine-D-alanine ligase